VSAGRSLAVDILKVGLACMVVGLHSHFLSDVNRPVSLALTGYLFRLAVPIFFLLNGYYLHGVIEDEARFYRWLRRIGLLYALWTVVYLPQFFQVGPQIVTLIATGYYHLWYLIAAAIGAWLLFRFGRSDMGRTLVVAGFLFAAGTSLSYAINYHILFAGRAGATSDLAPLYRNFLFFGFPSIAAGYAIARSGLEKLISTRFAFGLIAIGATILAGEYCLNIHSGVGDDFDMLFGLPFAGIGILLLALKSPGTTQSRRLGDLSTWIYLSHLWMLAAFETMGLTATVPLTLATIAACVTLSPLALWLNARSKWKFI
jgi:surface polysaccharide O-acyltransferase-like enzyme